MPNIAANTSASQVTQVIHVAVGIVEDAQGRILIARRAEKAHQGGLWEFPGGKLEAEETVHTALQRELREELGIEVLAAKPLIQVRHTYSDRRVLLDVWRVTNYQGTPCGLEDQPLDWVLPQQLTDYVFPAADRPIINALCGSTD